MIGQDDAASALEAIERTRQRAFELRGYAHAGEIVIGWGLVWLICNTLTYARPELSAVWPVGVTAGTLFSIWRGRKSGKGNWQATASAFTLVGLVGLIIAIAQIDSAAQGNAMVSTFVAAAYVMQSIWSGQRFAWIGLAIALFVILGWFVDRAHLELWLGLGGGGALILSGIWLRRA